MLFIFNFVFFTMDLSSLAQINLTFDRFDLICI